MGDDIRCRAMRSGDIPAITAIEEKEFSDPWPAVAFEEILVESRFIAKVVCDTADSPIGYICALCVADELQIQNIAIDAQYRRRGLGRYLLTTTEEEGIRRGATAAFLDVRSDNTAALALYAEMGYRRLGRRRDYYDNPPGDALLLFKSLRSAEEFKDGMVSQDESGTERQESP